MNALIPAPLIVCLLAAGLGLAAWQRPRLQAAIGLAGAAALLVAAIALLVAVDRHGVLTSQMGGWAAPVGITLVADLLGALLLVLAGVMAVAVAVYARADIAATPPHRGFYPLLHVVLLGVSGAFLTGDLFNLYVWFEVLLIGSFGLLSLGGGRPAAEGTVKALVLNIIGSLLFLLAVGATYGLAGTLNMADLHVRLAEVHAVRPAAVTAIAFVLVLAFATKAALMPLYFWLPASYHVPSASICALFAALLTKVGVYAMLRVFTLPFAAAAPVPSVVLLLTTLTMVSGVLGAVSQFEIKRILAWHSISQVGYILVGFGLLATPDPELRIVGLAATIFFVIHHGLVKPALFLVGGLVERSAGTTQLEPIGGLLVARPLLAVLFLLAALSLAGIPPLSGFWAKLAVVQAAVRAGHWGVLAAALGASLLTLRSMLKIWNEAFWKPRPEPTEGKTPSSTSGAKPAGPAGGPMPLPAGGGAALWAPTIALVVLVTLIGLWPRPLLSLARRAAESALTPSVYLEAVGIHSKPGPEVRAR